MITAENILHIVDIDTLQLSTALNAFITNQAQPTYTDCILKEHIYNVDDLLEDESLEIVEAVRTELEAIKVLCDTHEAGYFRVTY